MEHLNRYFLHLSLKPEDQCSRDKLGFTNTQVVVRGLRIYAVTPGEHAEKECSG